MLAEVLPQGRAKRLNIAALKGSELLQNQPVLDRSQTRFDQRRLRQPRALPVTYQYLAKRPAGRRI